MEKKLPSVFANKVNKDAGNNNKVFYSSGKDGDSYGSNSDVDARVSGNGVDSRLGSALAGAGMRNNDGKGPKVYKNVNQKINAIFNSSNYIYKADVEITLKDGKVTKRIVGKNTTHLITIENELIPLSDIIDIEQK